MRDDEKLIIKTRPLKEFIWNECNKRIYGHVVCTREQMMDLRADIIMFIENREMEPKDAT